jgi:opacity protein-like surface antigen
MLTALLLAYSAAAAAQDRGGAFVAGSASAANMESRTEAAFAGAFGYRANRLVAFVIEATAIPTFRSPFPVKGPVILSAGTATTATVFIYPGPVYTNPDGRIVLFTNAARIDIPTTSRHVTPFFIAGGGVANIRRTADLTYSIPILTPTAPTIPIQLRPVVQHITSSSTELALTLGGGVGVRMASSLWLDVDLRVFRLLDDDDHNLGRFGVGVRYTF